MADETKPKKAVVKSSEVTSEQKNKFVNQFYALMIQCEALRVKQKKGPSK